MWNFLLGGALQSDAGESSERRCPTMRRIGSPTGGMRRGLRSFVRTYVDIASDWRNLLFSFAFQGCSQQLTTSNSA
jgi:hypothetical protein